MADDAPTGVAMAAPAPPPAAVPDVPPVPTLPTPEPARPVRPAARPIAQPVEVPQLGAVPIAAQQPDPMPATTAQRPKQPNPVQPVPPYVTQVPARERIFQIYDDPTLEKHVMQRVLEDADRANKQAKEREGPKASQIKIDPKTLVFPPPTEVAAGQVYQSKVLKYGYEPHKAIYEPNFVVHRRLHFEEKNADRYGWDFGFIQPFVSTMYFYKDTLLWPNSLASGIEVGFWDTSAGKCLPGSPTPYYVYPLGLTKTGMLVEAGLFTGGAFILRPPGGHLPGTVP
jgi:hypothetical protein